jgi:hypothetical protein
MRSIGPAHQRDHSVTPTRSVHSVRLLTVPSSAFSDMQNRPLRAATVLVCEIFSFLIDLLTTSERVTTVEALIAGAASNGDSATYITRRRIT